MAKRYKIGDDWYRLRRRRLVKIPFHWVGHTVFRCETHKDCGLFFLMPKRLKTHVINKRLLFREFKEKCG